MQALNLLVDERHEVLMLVTNSLKTDLHHSNQFVVGLACTSLGNLASAEMARDLSTEIDTLLRHSNPYIRKKAAMCAARRAAAGELPPSNIGGGPGSGAGVMWQRRPCHSKGSPVHASLRN